MSNISSVIHEQDINICSSEEADQRIIRHVINLAKQGYKQSLVKTVDCDVAVLSIAYADSAHDHGLENLFVLYGPDEKYFDILEISRSLGIEVCKALPFMLLPVATQCPVSTSMEKRDFRRCGKISRNETQL